MELLNFVFRLGVVFAIFGFLWGILQLGYSLLRVGKQRNIGEDYLIKTIKYFFLVEVTFLFGYESFELNVNQLITTALILLTYFIGKLQNQQNRISMFKVVANGFPKNDVKFDLKAEIAVISISILIFIGFIFYPNFAQNPISMWFHDSIIDIENTTVFGFIFKVIGFIFMINLIMKMVNALTLLLSGKASLQSNNTTKEEDPNKFDDFEELQ